MKVRSILALAVVLCPVITAACEGAQDDEAAGTDAGAPTPTAPSASGTTAPPDPASEGEADGGLITEGGGGDPEAVLDDAGSSEIDAGGGAGTCGPAAGDGAAISSACSSTKAVATGGALKAGTYDLVGFTVTGTTTYCGAYASVKYAGRLDVEQVGNTYRLRERVRRTDGPTTRYPNRSFDANANGAFLEVTQTCGSAVVTKSWGYVLTTLNGKPVITYTHDVGTATVRFRWALR